MNKNSCDQPEPQVFRLHDAVVFVYSPEPEPAEPDPPPREYDESGVQALTSLAPLVKSVLRGARVLEGDVPDLLQAVLLDLLDWWEVRGGGAAPAPAVMGEIRAFVALVSRRTAYRHHRAIRRRREHWSSVETLLAALEGTGVPGVPGISNMPLEPSPEETVLAAEVRAELASELNLDALAAATSPAQWRAFYGYAVLGVPVEVIADSERAPTSTIYNRIRLARQDLRASIRRHRAAKRR